MPRLRTGTAKIWVKKQDDKCGCPKLRPKQSYLILGNQRRIGRSKIIAAGGRTGRLVDSNLALCSLLPQTKNYFLRNRDLNIGLDKKTVAIKWNDRFDHKLVVAKRRARKLCESPVATWARSKLRNRDHNVKLYLFNLDYFKCPWSCLTRKTGSPKIQKPEVRKSGRDVTGSKTGWNRLKPVQVQIRCLIYIFFIFIS